MLKQFAIDLEDEEPGDDCEDWDQFFQTRDGADDDFYNIIEVFEKKGYNIGNICTGIVNPATVFSYLIDYTKQDLTGLSHLAICVMSHGQAKVKLPSGINGRPGPGTDQSDLVRDFLNFVGPGPLGP